MNLLNDWMIGWCWVNKDRIWLFIGIKVEFYINKIKIKVEFDINKIKIKGKFHINKTKYKYSIKSSNILIDWHN